MSSNIDSILELLGRWTSEIKDWGQDVRYVNIDADSTLNGCEVEIILEVSDESDMSVIKDSKTFNLFGIGEIIAVSYTHLRAHET